MDDHSRFPVVRKLHRMKAEHVASYMQAIFSEYGWSDILVSDIGPGYTVIEFRQVMDDKGVHHITSSPHSPVKWSCRKVCPTCQKLVAQDQRVR